ncbi:MAG TPA: hypothetical protein VMT87_02165 [Vicinamibacteria bacterium]|nr:hypothetical protein [Vicinamibacteria bacterium]
MPTPPPLPRASWVPGALVLAAAAALALAGGMVLGARHWPLYLGLGLGGLLAVGWAEAIWTKHRKPAPKRGRAKLKVIRGGKHDYDLEGDDSTDGQRYLM